MKKLLIVLTRGRTGSSALIDDIDQHPDASCHQELFRTTGHSPHDSVPSFSTVLKSTPALTARRYVEGLAQAAATPVFGFKLLISNIDEWPAEVGLRELLLNQAHVVFLTRNPKSAAISAGIAKARNAYNIRETDTDQDYRERLSRRVVVDPQYVRDEVRYNSHWADQWLSELQAARTPHLHVTYEAYSADRLSILNQIFDFAGLLSLNDLARNSYVRVTSPVVWDDIENADEVRRAVGA